MPEEPYEWGNPDEDFLSRAQGTEVKLATAARRWRLQNGGAFEGMRFILHVPEGRGGSFKR